MRRPVAFFASLFACFCRAANSLRVRRCFPSRFFRRCSRSCSFFDNALLPPPPVAAKVPRQFFSPQRHRKCSAVNN